MTVTKTVDAELDKSLELDTLAVRANEAHKGVEAMGRSTLEYARVAGENLAKAKSLCKHGEWLPWLANNFIGSHKTAWQYVTVAESWPEIEANVTSGNISTLKGVINEVKSKPYAQQKIDEFRDERLSEAFAASELGKDVALLLGEIKQKGMGLTCVQLWGHSHDDAKVRKSEPQLKHILSQYEAGQSDAQIAELVTMVEGGEAESVFDAHRIRQAEREQTKNEAARKLAAQAAQDLVGHDKQVDPKGLAEVERIALEVADDDGWDQLNDEQKVGAIQTRAGEKQASSYEKPKPKKAEKDPENEITVKLGLLKSLKQLARFAPIAQRQEHMQVWNDKL